MSSPAQDSIRDIAKEDVPAMLPFRFILQWVESNTSFIHASSCAIVWEENVNVKDIANTKSIHASLHETVFASFQAQCLLTAHVVIQIDLNSLLGEDLNGAQKTVVPQAWILPIVLHINSS